MHSFPQQLLRKLLHIFLHSFLCFGKHFGMAVNFSKTWNKAATTTLPYWWIYWLFSQFIINCLVYEMTKTLWKVFYTISQRIMCFVKPTVQIPDSSFISSYMSKKCTFKDGSFWGARSSSAILLATTHFELFTKERAIWKLEKVYLKSSIIHPYLVKKPYPQ